MTSLLKRSMIKILLPSAAVVALSLFLVHSVAYRETLTHTSTLLSNKVGNYSGVITREIDSVRNVLQALGAVFYNGTFDKTEDNLEVFINFTSLYPKSTGFYGELKEYYYDGTLWVPDADWVAKDRPWYKAAKTGGGSVVFSDLYTDAMTHVTVTSVSQEVRTASGEILGVIALDYPLESVAKIVESLKSKEEGELIFILTDGGTFAVSSLFTADDNIRTADNGAFASMSESLLGGSAVLLPGTVRGKNYFFNSTKIGDTGWVLCIGEPQGQVLSFSREMSGLFIISFIVLTAIILIITAVTMVHISNPLKLTANRLSEIATGSADLTKRLEIPTSSEELYLIKNSFNDFVSHLQKIIKEIKETKEKLSEYGVALGKLVQDNTNFVTKMVENISSVDDEVGTQHEKVTSTATASRAISTSVEKLHDNLSVQKSCVDNSRDAQTNMVDSINKVTKSVDSMFGEFVALQSGLEVGIKAQSEVNKRIKEIEEQSKILSDANVTISSISEQTNLLAMNAAIEASHAGKAGQGFAVVAGEIRKLSENSATQSKRINDQLQAIMDLIGGAVTKSAESDKIFSDTSTKIDKTHELVEEIKTQSDEQSSASRAISRTLDQMLDATGAVRVSSDDVRRSQEEITGFVGVLKDSSDTVHQSVVEMRSNVDHVKSDNDKLFAIATEINDSLYRITKQIDLFQL